MLTAIIIVSITTTNAMTSAGHGAAAVETRGGHVFLKCYFTVSGTVIVYRRCYPVKLASQKQRLNQHNADTYGNKCHAFGIFLEMSDAGDTLCYVLSAVGKRGRAEGSRIAVVGHKKEKCFRIPVFPLPQGVPGPVCRREIPYRCLCS